MSIYILYTGLYLVERDFSGVLPLNGANVDC